MPPYLKPEVVAYIEDAEEQHAAYQGAYVPLSLENSVVFGVHYESVEHAVAQHTSGNTLPWLGLLGRLSGEIPFEDVRGLWRDALKYIRFHPEVFSSEQKSSLMVAARGYVAAFDDAYTSPVVMVFTFSSWLHDEEGLQLLVLLWEKSLQARAAGHSDQAREYSIAAMRGLSESALSSEAAWGMLESVLKDSSDSNLWLNALSNVVRSASVYADRSALLLGLAHKLASHEMSDYGMSEKLVALTLKYPYPGWDEVLSVMYEAFPKYAHLGVPEGLGDAHVRVELKALYDRAHSLLAAIAGV